MEILIKMIIVTALVALGYILCNIIVVALVAMLIGIFG